MVSFARAKTKSLLSRLWPMTAKPHNIKKIEVKKTKNLTCYLEEQNKCFLEASKNGGIWFS